MADNLLMATDGENYLTLAINGAPPNKIAECEAVIRAEWRKPLSAYLPVELPVFNRHSPPAALT